MKIETCIFKHFKDRGWEVGILINEGELILDWLGSPILDDIFIFKKTNDFTIDLLPIFAKIKERERIK